MNNYPLASSTWDDKEYQAIQRVIDSQMFTMGKEVFEYEHQFADFFGSKYAVMVSSGSTANLLMIAALFYTKDPDKRLSQGDEIIVPAVSWSTTYFPLQQYGLKLKFVDIDAETLNISVDGLRQAITEKTRAILTVNLLGNPNDFLAIQNMIADRNIVLLEDNCESMGAQFKGKLTGTYGLMGTFSSFFSHHISTMEGGCIITDDEELHHILLCLRAHGWTRNLPEYNLITGTKSTDPFEEAFRFVLPGYNVRPLEMSGAIGIEQLKKLPDLLKLRRQNAEFFQELFSDHDLVHIQKETGTSSWFGFSMVVRKGTSRKKVVDHLMNHGVECRPIVTGNFTKNPVLQYFNYELQGSMTNSDSIDKQGFFIGNHHYDLREKIQMVHRLLGEI